MRNPFKRGKRFVKNEENDIKDIWRRIRTRDFSGNTGLAVKNSVYQFSTNLSGKIGSFIFTVILARLLMPELFGLYALALSTILIFATISDLGIKQTIIRFISRDLSKKGKNSRAYTLYLGKMSGILAFVASVALFFSASYLADTFYQQPIFLALLAGVLYIIFSQVSGFFQSLLQASNNFRSVFKREVVFQISRIVLVPLAVVYALRVSLADEINLMIIIFFLAVSFFIAFIFLLFDTVKTFSGKISLKDKHYLSKKERSDTNAFILATAALALSGIFFKHIDRIMLGVFVDAEFIGFYTAAISLVGALAAMMGFGAIVLLPIFSRLKGKRLERGFKKSVRLTFMISLGAFVAIIALAYIAILIIYGSEYLPSVNILRALALIILIKPIIAIYQTYFISQGKPKTVAKLLIGATILNIALNYILISALLQFGQTAAVFGAVTATLTSQFAYLGGLVWVKRRR